MGYYSAIKKNKIMSFAATWVDLGLSHWVKPDKKTNIIMNLFTKQESQMQKTVFWLTGDKGGQGQIGRLVMT